MNTSFKSLLSALITLLVKIHFLIEKINTKLTSTSIRIPTLA